MPNITLEICCGSIDDVFAAAAAGADRVELNSAMFLGGLTPSIGAVREAKKAGIPIMAMVRPRDGGFCYSRREFDGMLEDIRVFVREGVDGLVFGVLNPDGSVDALRNSLLIEAAQGCETVFHRAFDVVPDWKSALDTLIRLGFNRVLTSGQASSALLGAETIKEMVAYANGRIQILPGGGIRHENAAKLIEKTGCTQLHSSCGTVCRDISCDNNPAICFRSSADTPGNEYPITDGEKVRALLRALGR